MVTKFDKLFNKTMTQVLSESILQNPPTTPISPGTPQAPQFIRTKRDLMSGGQTIKAGSVLTVLKSDSAAYHAQPQQITPNQPNPLGQPVSIALDDAEPVVDEDNKKSNSTATTNPPTSTPTATSTTENEETVTENVKIYTSEMKKFK